LKPKFRQSMAWLHGWAGVTVGWILYAVFVTGTLSYFREELSHWMRPELSAARMDPDAIARGLQILEERAPHSPRWLIDAPEPRRPTLRLGWTRIPEPGKPSNLLRRFESIELDPATGDVLHGRQTRGGEFFQRFHSELSLEPQWGRWLVGACAMVMLVAILSGLITHRKILQKLFTFRPGRDARAWREGHNVAGVLALPFHVMITYTGLVTLMLMYMPAGVDARYGYNPGEFLTYLMPGSAAAERAGLRAELTAIEPLLLEASRHWNGASPASLSIEHPGYAGARIHMRRSDTGRISANTQTMTFDGATGQLLAYTPQEPPALRTYGVLKGLHLARFASGDSRWMFAFCGLMGAAMVATGLILWSRKRVPASGDSRLWQQGYRVIQVLNVGAIAGIWLGVAAYFLANRLLAADLASRAEWEVRCFFIAWALSFVAAGVQGARRAWSTQFAIAAISFAAIPIVSAMTTEAHLGNSLGQGLWIYAGVDLTMIGLAGLFATIAWYASRPSA